MNEQGSWRGFALAAFALGLGARGETTFFTVNDVAFFLEAGKFGAQIGALVGFEIESAGELGLVQRSVIRRFEQRLNALAKVLHGVILV